MRLRYPRLVVEENRFRANPVRWPDADSGGGFPTMIHGMVSAAQPEAVEAGAEALKSGGNAVDAAVAAALVQTAVDPQMAGIAGFGCMQVYDAQSGAHVCIDFYARAPLAARPDMWEKLLIGQAEDGFGFFLTGQTNEIGYGAIGTPTTLAALATASKRFGAIAFADLVAKAIPHCVDGFMVRPHVAAYWNQVPTESSPSNRELLTRLPATRKIYLKPDGWLYGEGDILRNPDMGRTLGRIAARGYEDFYSGEIAREIAQDMREHLGLLSKDDLAHCAPQETQPQWGSYRGYRIAANPPPGAGLQLIEMLNILEHFDLKSMGHNSPDYVATVAEAMKIGTIDREAHLGDPKFIDVPADRLASKDYAKTLAERIARGEKTPVPRMAMRHPVNTTQVCAADAKGMCVTLTHTLGAPSGVVTPGLGFMYNGAMAAMDPRPGRAGSIAPGKARASTMAPAIVFKDDRPFLVVGAPGGTFTGLGILQSILNAVDFGMTALEAVIAPRFSATSDVIWLSNRMLRSVERDLVARGYPVKRSPLTYHFAGVHAIRIVDGKFDGGADPARDGMALLV